MAIDDLPPDPELPPAPFEGLGLDVRIQGSSASTVSFENGLGRIHAWAAAQGRPFTLRQLAELDNADVPLVISDALAIVLDSPLATATPAQSVTSILCDLVDVGDERATTILMLRHVLLGKRPTLESIGEQFGIARERVRQVESQVRTTFREKVQDLLDGPALALVTDLRQILGAHAPLRAAEDRLAPEIDENALEGPLAELLTGTTAKDRRIWLRDIAVAAAGGYVLDERWIERHDAPEMTDLLDRFRAWLGNDGRGAEAAMAWLSREAQTWFPDELLRFASVRTIDRRVFPWTGSLADKAYILLLRHGVPATIADLIEEAGEGSEGTLRSYVSTDERFQRVDGDRIGLTEWGGEAYTSINEAIERCLEKSGEVRLDDLVEDITSRFSVNPGSVRAQADGPRFATEDGVVRPRRGGGDQAPPLRDVGGCYFVDGHWYQRVEVSAELLRGSGVSCSLSFAAHVGVAPNEAAVHDSPMTPISISRRSLQPSLGRLRAVADELELLEGDRLFVGWDPAAKRFLIRSVNVADAESEPWRAVVQMCGGPIPDFPAHAVELLHEMTVPHAQGLLPHLHARREGDIARVIQLYIDEGAADAVEQPDAVAVTPAPPPREGSIEDALRVQREGEEKAHVSAVDENGPTGAQLLAMLRGEDPIDELEVDTAQHEPMEGDIEKERPGGPWSRREVEAVVNVYLRMLSSELTGGAPSKTKARQKLSLVLPARTEGAIELRLCSISAALQFAGLPYIAGYTPGTSSQLVDEVVAELASQYGIGGG